MKTTDPTPHPELPFRPSLSSNNPSAVMEKHDISDHSGSDHEKQVEDNLEHRLNKEIPDPDTHLTDAERAAIVSLSNRVHWMN